MSEAYDRYYYDGPVLEFNRVIAEHWTGSTYAPTKERARSNLAYQFKKQYNRVPASKITLPGNIEKIG